MDDDNFIKADTIPSSAKQPGQEFHILGYAKCCRIWPIVVTFGTDWGRCGICGKKPKLIPGARRG